MSNIIADTVKERRIAAELEGKIPVSRLKVGKFADLNGSIIYRYESDKMNIRGFSSSSWWIIEKHNHKSPYDHLYSLEHSEPGENQWQFYVKPIEVPKKKHVDNAVAHLRDESKKGSVDGLCYLENITRLKEYLKVYGKQKDIK